MMEVIISTNVNKSLYVTYISTTPFVRLRNGWIRLSGCLGKYIMYTISIIHIESACKQKLSNKNMEISIVLSCKKYAKDVKFKR